MAKFFKGALTALIFVAATGVAKAQTAYNAVATAYVTTNITQTVVFDSTMQAGGTFEFSVLAHNGGGRTGQSDTANVKIQFYSASNALISTVNTSYSNNLPQPSQSGTNNSQGVMLSGNPQADPAVPWTKLSISSTNCGGSCATVAYAKVTMYGVDGSFWAGDYGPWYRAPTFTLNGGSNLLYNPEFGPYNGTNAQGWSISPALGACQGAWGGSNACIVDNNGTPGQNTVGLVANQNGGGPSATGGTASGTAGGYNNSMSVSNPGPGTTGGVQAPTLVSTVTTNQTRTVIVGNQSQTVTTPVTTKTYSDGSTVVTNGTATTTTNSSTAFTGVHFGRSQVADTQWNVTACTTTSTCQIYSTLPGVTYNTQSPVTVGATQYITFIPNTGSDSASMPWEMILVNSDGTYTSLGSCKVDVQGVDSNGYIYLFVQNANMNGTLFSANLGLTGQGMTFTGIMNPSVSDTNTAAGDMSSTPLAAGQTGGNIVPPGPQAVNISAGASGTNPTGTTTLAVTNAGTYTNNGTNGDVTNSGTFTNNGTTGDVTNDGTFTNNSGGVVGAVTNNASGTFDNTGTTGNVTNAGTFTNNTGGVTGTVDNSGTFTNNGTTGAFTNSGTLTNGGTIASLTNTGTASNSGTITGTVTNTSGTFTNTGTTGDWTNSAVINNSGTMGNGTNNANATFTNSGTIGNVANAGTFTNNANAVAGDFTNSGTVSNAGTLASLTNTGTATNTGTITGALTNTTGTFTNSGTTGDWLNNDTIVNSGTMGNGTNNSAFTNNGAVGTVINTGTFANNGTLTSINNSGVFATNSVTLSSYTQSSTGSTVTNYGQQITVNGTASLGGGLTIINGPTAYGKYPTFLTANSIVGQYDTYTGPGVLKYTSTGISFWIMPDGTVVQSGVNSLAANMSSMNTLASSSITSGLGNDCMAFGSNNGCVSVSYGNTKAASGDLNSAGITVSKAINPNWRVGLFATQQLNSPTLGAIKYDSNSPATGGFIGWNMNTDGTGLGVTLSATQGDGNYTINGTDKANVKAQAVQAKASYGIKIDDTTVVTPYAGVRNSTFNVAGYTEANQTFPLTYSAIKQSTTDVIAGVGVGKKITDKLSGNVSVGVVHNVANSVGSVNATSDMGNFNSPLKGSKYTSASFGAGLSYEVLPNQRIGVNVGWQQKSLTGANIGSIGISYTIGF